MIPAFPNNYVVLLVLQSNLITLFLPLMMQTETMLSDKWLNLLPICKFIHLQVWSEKMHPDIIYWSWQDCDIQYHISAG